jgi:hypothetical protein
MSIRAAHYAVTEERLTRDPIVKDMALDLYVGGILPAQLAPWDDDTVTHGWSMRLNARYREMGGTDGGHIGAVPTAVLTLLTRVHDAVAAAALGQ